MRHMFVDADDYLDKNCYEQIVKVLEKNNSIDFIRYNLNVVGSNDTCFKSLYELSDTIYDFSKLDDRCLSHFVTRKENIDCLVMLLVIKSSIAKKLQFNNKLTMMEDVDFYLQLFFKKPIGYFLDKKLYNYYVNPNSVTNSPNYYRKNIFGVLDTNVELCKKLIKSNYERIIPDVNSANINTIINTVQKLYEYDKTKYIEVSNNLKTNGNFIELCKNSGKMKLNKKVIIFLILHCNIKIQILYLNMRKIIKKK